MENITEDEAALYDRQIRLWGLDAQRRLRAARVLLIGVRGLGAEVAKNIILSGVKAVTLLDHTVVTEEDSCCNFLAPRESVGNNRAESARDRAQLLNPMVDVRADSDNVADKPDEFFKEFDRAESARDRAQLLNPMVDVRADSDNVADKPDEFFKEFDVICALCCRPTDLYRINQICADNKIKFFCGDVFGYYGYLFSDLGYHEYAEEITKKIPPKAENDDDSGEPAAKKSKKEETETVVVKNSVQFTRLKDALEVDWSKDEYSKKLKRTPNTYFIMQVLLQFMENHSRRMEVKTVKEDQETLAALKKEVFGKINVKTDIIDDEFTKKCFAEISPVCAVVGGVLGQEIIKAVSQRDAPHNNFFFYNGTDGGGLVDKIGN